jgi:hypothetical protein
MRAIGYTDRDGQPLRRRGAEVVRSLDQLPGVLGIE